MSAEIMQNRARTLSWLVAIPLGLFALATMALFGNVIWQGGRFLGTVLIHHLPMFLYLAAIWMVWKALREIARGELFGHIVPRLLLRVGVLLFLGALYNEIGKPLLSYLALGWSGLQTFDPSGITLGVVGAALAVFAHLLGKAAEQNDELKGFV